jgi:hypothetical protein
MARIRVGDQLSARALTEYARRTEPDENELEIPEDLTELNDDELSALAEQARGAFDALYGDGNADLSEEQLNDLQALADGIEALRGEQERRDGEAEERRNRAAEIAGRVNPRDEADDSADENGEDGADGDEGDEGGEGDSSGDVVEITHEAGSEDEQDAIAASSNPPRRQTRINLSSVRSRQSQTPAPNRRQPQTMRDVVMAAPDVPGFANGQGMDFDDMGRAVNARLQTFPHASYAQAAQQGKHLRQQFGVAVINKPFGEGLTIDSADEEAVEEVFKRASDESRLPGGSLVASGGWCAPSETLYDLFEVEGRDGIFSLPEVNVSRGGIKFTPGPDFSTLFSAITGFHYTEANDTAGTYAVDANGLGTGAAGSKPCYKVTCPSFQEVRLDVDGLCITAGLLQQRGYPEVIARTIRGALVAHDNRLAARKLASVSAGSTAVALAANQVGAVAPVLTAIELQVEHYRQTNRLPRGTSLEAVFPYWVRGAIRTDLSRRLGDELSLFAVTDAQIAAWFTQRGINAQFVYNWNDLATTAATAISWPTSVKFLLYAAGTWIGGGSDVITLDTLYDSTMLGKNDYTALFTEEGVLVAKRGHDSRVVTVPISPSGQTAGGTNILFDGTQGP